MAENVPGNLPPFLINLLRRYPLLIFAPLVLIVIVALLTLFFFFTVAIVSIGMAIIAALIQLYRFLNQLQKKLASIDAIKPDQQTPSSVDHLPHSPDFRLATLADAFKPQIGGQDSPDNPVAQRFKDSLKDVNLLLNKSIEMGLEPKFKTLDLAKLGSTMHAAIDPERTISARILKSIHFPDHIAADQKDSFKEAWAYPEFDTPMYKPLKDISADLFLPNIQRIEQNSITLLETNQRFIEAYMVGLNHEFARELLWREYPTDQRGSYFRQFWDVSGYLNSDPQMDPAALKEKLRDIPAIHRWPSASNLGEHDQREESGKAEEEVVLVIRGELLKKYPTAVIYAHRAKWHANPDGTIDRTQERLLDPQPDEVGDNPPRDKIKTPLYEAKIEPDIYFFGFDLTVEAAMGEMPDAPDDPGWFFIIKERPGEPRFGLDIEKQKEINVWNDLSWLDVIPTDTNGSFLKFSPSHSLLEPTSDPSKQDQYKEDTSGGDDKVSWDENTNSAEVAYILFQTPVLIAIHGAELLKKT
jgi:hypothetical protein